MKERTPSRKGAVKPERVTSRGRVRFPALAMAPRLSFSRFRFFLALFYLGALFLCIGSIYAYIQAFEGIIVVGLKESEDTVVCAVGAMKGVGGLQRRLPMEVIPFHNPKRVWPYLDKKQAYETATLPWRLSLEEVEVIASPPPQESLYLEQGGDKAQFEVKVGATIEWKDFHATVREIRPWSGLIRHPKGHPMAAVALREEAGNWTEKIFLQQGQWVYAEPDIALSLKWFKNEAQAKQALPQRLEEIGQARWGILDGAKMIWLRALSPGTGAILEDDTEVTLLKYEEQREGGPQGLGPAILVEFKTKQGQIQRHWYPANQGDKESPVRFLNPRARKTHIILHAWREGAAWCSLFHEGAPIAGKRLEAGESWLAQDFPYTLRLAQVMPTSLPVDQSGDTLWQAVLSDASGELALREGALITRQGLRIRYRRSPRPPKLCYRFAVKAGEESLAFSLRPGQHKRVRGWVFRQQEGHARPLKVAVLEAQRALWTPARILGGALILCGAFGLVFLRFAPGRGGKSREGSA